MIRKSQLRILRDNNINHPGIHNDACLLKLPRDSALQISDPKTLQSLEFKM